MSEIVERVARASCRADGFDPDDLLCTGSTDLLWTSWEPGARAAIEAMREPTDALCEAGYSAGTGDWGGKYDNRRELARGRVQPTWQAMIDAALKVQP